MNKFDGIICFGGVDWWYHNRGHYDLQMMREFSKTVPVLYVNSIGMRRPSMSEGSVFLKRVARKARSLSRGLTRVRENFSVFSPITLPGQGRMAASVQSTLGTQVLRAARRCGIKRPLVWVACPPAVRALEEVVPECVVYQRTDRFESFSGVDSREIAGYDRELKRRADLVLFCATALYEEERASCRSALFVDHGVDFERFSEAGDRFLETASGPDDMAVLRRPRAGFIGGIDSHTFDPALFVEVATQMPDIEFILVGGCSLPKGWCDLPNVKMLGRKPYDEVADYMAACDVLIMPWNQNSWIEACNPVKLKEYLAVGRPVVSTGFPELQRYRDHVLVADGAVEFVSAIREALSKPHGPELQRSIVQKQTWDAKAAQVQAAFTGMWSKNAPAIA